MSQYTSLGITVSPVIADGFVEIVRGLDFGEPDQLARTDDGSVTAVWENRNHLCDSPEYRAIMEFLEGIPEDLYSYESITEGYEPETGGGYGFNFSTRTVYEVYGTPFGLGKGKTVSRSWKLGRRSG